MNKYLPALSIHLSCVINRDVMRTGGELDGVLWDYFIKACQKGLHGNCLTLKVIGTVTTRDVVRLCNNQKPRSLQYNIYSFILRICLVRVVEV